MIRPLMRYILVLLGLHHMVQTIERPTGKTKSQTVPTWREASAKQWRTSERKTEGHFSNGVPQHAWQRIQHRTNYKSSKDQTTSSSDSLVVELKHFFCMLQGEHSDQLPAAWHLLFTTLTALMMSGGCFVLEGCFVLSTPGSCRSRQESRGPRLSTPRLHTNPHHNLKCDLSWDHEVNKLSQCSFSTSLTLLNTSKTKEMIISFRKQKEEPAPIHRKRRSGEGDQL